LASNFSSDFVGEDDLDNLGFGLGHLMERNWVDSVLIIYLCTVGAVTRVASHFKQQIL